MRIRSTHIIYLMIMVIILFFTSCDEQINSPCYKNIKIELNLYQKDCRTGTVEPINGTVIFKKYDGNGTYEESSPEIAIVDGKVKYAPDYGICGISISYEVTTELGIKTSLPMHLTNDTLITKVFQCEDEEKSVSCEILEDINSVLMFTDDNGKDILDKSSEPIPGDFYHQFTGRLMNAGQENIQINVADVNKILDYNNANFAFRKSTPTLVRGQAFILKAGESLVLGFNGKTGIVGTHQDIISIGLHCSGTDKSWNIELHSEVKEQLCDCPDTGKNLLLEYKYNEYIDLNDTKIFSPEYIFKNSNKECPVSITNIQRINSAGNAIAYNSPGNWSWFVDVLNPLSLANSPVVIDIGKEFFMAMHFTPTIVGEICETFRITVKYADAASPCSYDVTYCSNGCGNGCPIIRINSITNYKVTEIENGNSIVVSGINRPFSSTKDIIVDMPVALPLEKTDPCYIKDDYNPKYELNFSVGTDVNICNGIEVSSVGVEIGSKFFIFKSDTRIIQISESDYSIIFKAPTKREIEAVIGVGNYDSNVGANFSYRIVLTAKNNPGCKQTIVFNTNVGGLPKPSPVRTIYAYNQISPKRSKPWKHYIDVPDYDEKNTGYGRIGNSDGVIEPNNGTFFIEVDSPKNFNILGQRPRFYLVSPSNGNEYVYVDKIASNFTSDQFENASPGLFQTVKSYFNTLTLGTKARYPTTPFDIATGDVLVIYSDIRSDGKPCKIALIYVNDVDNGGISSSGDDLTTADFIVMYSVNIK